MLGKYNKNDKVKSDLKREKDLLKKEQDKKELILPATALEGNARCVPVGTILITPDGRNEKKERFKGKSEFIKFRCSIYEKKMLRIRAKQSGLSLSEFCRRAIYEKEIKERLSDDQIEIYKTLLKYHNNFKAIGNMFRKRDPKLTSAVYKLADEIKIHLQNLNQ
ncbi:mobilization protein MbpA [Gramella sp. AN32]|uniref:Mobilization protein MbpA n=1 Tax=Christiangramia antarctica TaxID=2058158 RepID=A0ABW5X2J5_9FLAO|nr:mobilization protein MbpA [Gramella sp. AN32]